MTPISLNVSNLAIVSTCTITIASLYIIWYLFKRNRLHPGLASLPLVTGAIPFVGAGFKVQLRFTDL